MSDEQRQDFCVWRYIVDDYYETDCDNGFTFTNDGPAENGFQVCPYCGKRIKLPEENYSDR